MASRAKFSATSGQDILQNSSDLARLSVLLTSSSIGIAFSFLFAPTSDGELSILTSYSLKSDTEAPSPDGLVSYLRPSSKTM